MLCNFSTELTTNIIRRCFASSKQKITPREKKRLFSRGGNFLARSRFARSTVPEEKWGTTRSLGYQHEVYKQSCVTEGFGGTP